MAGQQPSTESHRRHDHGGCRDRKHQPAAHGLPAVTRELSAGQRRRDAQFLARRWIPETQDHRVGDPQRSMDPFAVEERAAPRLVPEGGAMLIGQEHRVPPGHERAERRQLEFRITPDPDHHADREGALLAVQPRHHDRCPGAFAWGGGPRAWAGTPFGRVRLGHRHGVPGGRRGTLGSPDRG